MGVDATLYILNPHVSSNEIIAATVIAAGWPLPVDRDGKPDIFMAPRQYFHCKHEIAFGFGTIEREGRQLCFVHGDSLDSAVPNAFLLSARSRPETLAIFREVAKALGGFLIWRDSDDEGRLYSRPDDASYTDMWEIVKSMKPAVLHLPPSRWQIGAKHDSDTVGVRRFGVHRGGGVPVSRLAVLDEGAGRPTGEAGTAGQWTQAAMSERVTIEMVSSLRQPWTITYRLRDGRVWWTALFQPDTGVPEPGELPTGPYRIELQSTMIGAYKEIKV